MSLLSKRIKELRLENNLTQEQLGALIGVKKPTICSYETERKLPSLDNLKLLSETFKVSVDYLLGIDSYIVADNNSDYGINISKEEILIIKELRKNPDLLKKLIDDPKRTIELINKKLK